MIWILNFIQLVSAAFLQAFLIEMNWEIFIDIPSVMLLKLRLSFFWLQQW